MDGHIAKYMGVAVDQLFADAVRNVVQGEGSRVLLNGGVEHHLEKHVAQFLLEAVQIVVVDGLHRLIGFLQEIAPDRLVGLLHVPGAAARVAQNPDDFHQVLTVIERLVFPVYHSIT